MSDHGLLTTVAYKLGRHTPCCYALEVCDGPPVAEHFSSVVAKIPFLPLMAQSEELVPKSLMVLLWVLQGSVAIAGAVVQWLKNNMGMVQTSSEIGEARQWKGWNLLFLWEGFHESVVSEKLAAEVGTSHGCYFVPAFSGLYAPYWEPSARG